MLRLPAFALAAAMLSAAAAQAALVRTDVPYLSVSIGDATPVLLLPAFGADRFSGRFTVVECDGSVLEATSCDGSVVPAGSALIEVTGDKDPFIALAVGFADGGESTKLSVSVFTPILPITGAADWTVQGSITVPAIRGTAVETNPVGAPLMPSDKFIEARAFSASFTEALVHSLGDGPVTQLAEGPNTTPLGPESGTFGCSSITGCASIQLTMGLNGLGGGQQTDFTARFDFNPAPTAAVPLPVPVALLAAGLGLLGLAGRRRA